jgi:hypothetical protein
MEDSESGTTSADDSASVNRRHFDSTVLHRRQAHLRTVRNENSRLDETVRIQWQQVRALRQQHERIESEDERHNDMLRECYEGIRAVLRTLEDSLGGAPLLLKDSPTVTESPFADAEDAGHEGNGSGEDELCNLVTAAQDYVSEMRKIDQLLMASSSVSSL